ncbi:hypothetical protein C0Q70_14574 [Pomacea canaliculata]|uniref:Protein quiver n=1 Tax=Pomacea canaliculata TaxID=400727 RepID=A0A2T7NSF4_POMCA|nr:hypothetical protein C0Q70_14574 [Pomacea canaliculata]
MFSVQAGIGCFTCSSINGSDPSCEDPFNPITDQHYQRMCWQTMKNRKGEYPARYCTKIKGVNVRTRIQMTVRSCGMETLDNTCSTFYFQSEQYYGCLMSCKTNGCNGAEGVHGSVGQQPLKVLLYSVSVLVTCVFRLPLG